MTIFLDICNINSFFEGMNKIIGLPTLNGDAKLQTGLDGPKPSTEARRRVT